MRFDGRVALITGGNSGIGEATALRFVEEGARVALIARDRERGERLVDQIRNSQGDAEFFGCDVRDEEQVEAMVDSVGQRFGRIDILFNNAGIINFGSVVDASIEEWDDLMATNVRSVFLVSHYVVPQMIAAGGGSIINVGSNLGMVGTRGLVAYAASKGAVIQLTRAMALDHAGDNIRVNCVCPGTIETPMVQRQRIGRSEAELRQSAERVPQRFPIGRLGTPEEVAAVVAFLASDEASFVTGAIYAVDGGYTTQ